MRATTTQEAAVLAAQERSNYLRARTKDHTGTFIDLSALKDYNWIKRATWTESVDNYVATAEVDLQRENQLLSLANLVAASVLNSGGPLLEIGRELIIETATLPVGIAPGSSDWHMVFHGYIDEIDWEQTPIKVLCRDLAGQLLQDTQIESEKSYGLWESVRAVLAGYVISPSGNPPNGQPSTSPQYWECTTPGTTGATEPPWPASPSPGATLNDNGVIWTYRAAVAWSAGSSRAVGSFTANPTNALQYWQCTASTGNTGGSNPFPSAPTQGQIVTDGGVTWQYFASLAGTAAEIIIQEIINDTLGAGVVALSTPAASNWFLQAFTQSRDKLFSAISDLAQAMGWDLRYWWNQSAGDYQLTLQSVPRSAPSVAWTFGPGSYFDFDQVARTIENVRNAVTVVFSDSENLDPTTGQPLRSTVAVSDATSIGKYKRRAMEIAEDSSGSIATRAMATVLANAALSDLKEPLADVQVELPYFWAVQLNDYVTFQANGVHFDSDQSLAVIAFQHTLDLVGQDGSSTERTQLTLRGLPTAGAQKHLDKEVGSGAPAYSLKSPVAANNLVVKQTLAGAKISFAVPKFGGSKYLIPELHVSTISGFTPSSTTLKDMGWKSAHIANDLVPGTTYCAKIVMRDQRGNVASSSQEQSFTAGYARLGVLATDPTDIIDPALTQNFGVRVALSTLPTSNWFKWDTVDYDTDSILDSTNWDWTFLYDGKVTISARAIIAGAQAGDSARLKLQKWNTGTLAWDDWAIGKTYPLVTQAQAGSPPTFTDVFEVEYLETLPVLAGDKFRLGWDLYAATIPSPAWVINPGGTANFSASYIRCQQELA